MSQEVMNELVNMSQEIIKLKDQRREMLEVLKEVFVIGDTLVSDVYGSEFVEKARAAISKAEGANT